MRRAALLAVSVFALLLPAAAMHRPIERRVSDTPLEVVRAYLKATLARDHGAAYKLVSSADRDVIDEHRYLETQPAPTGFAATLARKLAESLEVVLVERQVRNDRAQLTLEYTVPTADELSPMLLNWKEHELNALPTTEQQRILSALSKLQSAQSRVTTSGRQTLQLVQENGHWKILLGWRSRTPVSFDAVVAGTTAADVEVLQRKIFAGNDEPFQTGLKIRNLGAREAFARIEHRIEPQAHADRITMIACGFLRPLKLRPGEEVEVASAYLLDQGFPRHTPLHITFELKVETLPSATAR